MLLLWPSLFFIIGSFSSRFCVKSSIYRLTLVLFMFGVVPSLMIMIHFKPPTTVTLQRVQQHLFKSDFSRAT